jgi:hypothetical protein
MHPVALNWALLLGFGTLAPWAVWVGLGHGTWVQWFANAWPAALMMGGIGYTMGYVLAHPAGPPPQPVETQAASVTQTNNEEQPGDLSS